MSFDYDQVRSISEEEFHKRVKPVEQLRNDTDYRASSDTELRKVENLLDVQNGTLNSVEFFIKKAQCETCKSELGIVDVTQTALIDAKHSKSAILHTLVGSKYVVNNGPRQVRCAQCSTLQKAGCYYETSQYGCCSE